MSGEGSAGSGRPRLFESAKGALRTALSLGVVRLQLLGVELDEEATRLVSLLAYGAIALIALGAGVVFLAVFITVLLWDSNRLLALGVFSALFLGAGAVALVVALGHARRKSVLFAASLVELRKDREALGPEE
jgi:uncharacterized membrane protein YqjE